MFNILWIISILLFTPRAASNQIVLVDLLLSIYKKEYNLVVISFILLFLGLLFFSIDIGVLVRNIL